VFFVPEWESALGIPDDCFPGDTTGNDIDTRRTHILVKLAALGVQTSADFEALATTMGFPGTEVVSGEDAGIQPPDGRFTIVINYVAGTFDVFPLSFEIEFGNSETEILDCLFEKLKPANCVIDTRVDDLFERCSMPLIEDLSFSNGVGPATFTRSGPPSSFLDKDDGLLKFATGDNPRFEANGLLLEGASTNLLLRSEELDNAAWTKDGSITTTADNGTDPEGNTTADKFDFDGTANAAISQSVTAAAAADNEITLSFYIKKLSGTFTSTDALLQMSGAGMSSTATLNFGVALEAATIGDWVRYDVTGTTAGGGGTVLCEIQVDVISSLEIWGAQDEELNFATSYMPTVASTASRNADALVIDEANMQLASNSYTFNADIDVLGVSTNSATTMLIYDFDGEANRNFSVGDSGASKLKGRHGLPTVVSASALTPLTQTRATYAVDAVGDVSSVFFDGTETAGSRGTVTPETFGFRIGNNSAMTRPFYGHIQSLRTFDKALTQAQVDSL
jgi:hypothetical protein